MTVMASATTTGNPAETNPRNPETLSAAERMMATSPSKAIEEASPYRREPVGGAPAAGPSPLSQQIRKAQHQPTNWDRRSCRQHVNVWSIDSRRGCARRAAQGCGLTQPV